MRTHPLTTALVASFFILSATFFSPDSLLGQQLQTGTLVGSIRDAKGAVIQNASVRANSPVLIQRQSVSTDAEGEYRLILLPIGTYSITVEANGFGSATRQGIQLSADQTLKIDVTLDVSGVTQAIEVSSTNPVVDVKSVTTETTLGLQMLQDLPTARDVWSLLQNQAPGVTTNQEDVGGGDSGLQSSFSVHGSSSAQNTFAFNGINVTGVNSPGTTDLYFDYDSFQEVDISTSAHKAEVGTPGVYINIVPHIATDRWHGGAQGAYTGNSLQANNVGSSLQALGFKSSNGIALLQSFSGQAGGPVTGKLRAYINYHYDKVNLNVIGAPVNDGTTIQAPLVNATYQLNPANRINALFTYNKYNKPHRGASSLAAVNAVGVEDDHTTVYGIDWTSNLNSRTILNTRVGYVGQAFDILLEPGVTLPSTTEQSTGYVSNARATWFRNNHLRLQLSGYLNYFHDGWLGGSHDVKIGYDFSRGPNQAATFAFDDINLFTLNGAPFEVEQYNTPALTRAISWFYPIYVQDTFTRGRTTVSVGLRFDGYSGSVRATSVKAGTYAPARSFPGQPGPTFNNFVPRIAVVHDLLGNSKIALKAAYGRYDNVPSTGWFSAISQAGLGGSIYRWNNPTNAPYSPSQVGALVSTFGGSITSLDPHVQRPHTDEWVAGIDTGLIPNVRLSVDFTYRQEGNLLGVINTGVPFSSFSPVLVPDPGPTGTGTGTIQVFNQNPATIGHDKLLITNPSGYTEGFHGLDVVAQRRFNKWQMLASVSYSHQSTSALAVNANSLSAGDQESSGNSTTASPFLNPNFLINNSGGPTLYNRPFMFRSSGSYSLPLGFQVSGVFKTESGIAWTRVLTASKEVNGMALAQGSVTVYAEPRGRERLPELTTFDLRGNKTFRFVKEQQSLKVMADIFNLFNTNTTTSINGATGAKYGYPLTILGPRILRLGVSYNF